MNIAILCGGKGSRLSTVSNGLPKILIPINNKPFIYILLDSLINNGITNIYLLTSYKSEEIRNEIGQKYKNVPITFIEDRKSKKSGTASALLNALSILPDFFLLQYGDTILDINYGKFHEKAYSLKKKVLMAIYENKNNLDKNNVLFYCNKLRYLNLESQNKSNKKPNFIDYGLMSFHKSFLNEKKFILKKNSCLKFFQQELSISNLIEAFIATKRFYEIGTPYSYKDFIDAFNDGDLNPIINKGTN